MSFWPPRVPNAALLTVLSIWGPQNESSEAYVLESFGVLYTECTFEILSVTSIFFFL